MMHRMILRSSWIALLAVIVLATTDCSTRVRVSPTGEVKITGIQLPERCRFVTLKVELKQGSTTDSRPVTVNQGDTSASLGTLRGYDFSRPIEIRVTVVNFQGDCAPFTLTAIWEDTETLSRESDGTYSVRLEDIRKIHD